MPSPVRATRSGARPASPRGRGGTGYDERDRLRRPNAVQLSRAEIEQIIPHRAPFIFVDEISEVEFGKRAVGLIHDVGAYGDLLAGHFPGFAVMPGLLLGE